MKDTYIKPEIEVFELRVEERFAGTSDNCHAEKGSVKSNGNPCEPAVLWSSNKPIVP